MKYDIDSIPRDLDTLREIDKILREHIEFPDPQPKEYFHTLGTNAQDRCTSAHEFLLPRKYVSPDRTAAVIVELVLLRVDYWYRKTHEATKSHVNIRMLAGYQDLAEEISGIVLGVDTVYHQFHMPKRCAAFEAHQVAIERGLLPLCLPSGTLIVFTRKHRRLPPPPLLIRCENCGNHPSDPITKRTEQDEFRSGKFPRTCGICNGKMIEIQMFDSETFQPSNTK